MDYGDQENLSDGLFDNIASAEESVDEGLFDRFGFDPEEEEDAVKQAPTRRRRKRSREDNLRELKMRRAVEELHEERRMREAIDYLDIDFDED